MMKLTTLVLSLAASTLATTTYSQSSSAVTSTSVRSGGVNQIFVGSCMTDEEVSLLGFAELPNWQQGYRMIRSDRYGSRPVGAPTSGPHHLIESRSTRIDEDSATEISYRLTQKRTVFNGQILGCEQEITATEWQ